MDNHKALESRLLETYRELRKENAPKWAVHKISEGKRDQLVVPTIPFIGKNYAQQKKKIRTALFFPRGKDGFPSDSLQIPELFHPVLP